MGRNLEGEVDDLTEVPSLNVLERATENHDKSHSG
jgi:hypothetical protein